MAENEVKIDDKEIIRLLSRLDGAARKARPAMKAIGEYMIKITDERFSSEKDPDGNPWKPLSPVTLGLSWRMKGRKTHTQKGVSAGFARYSQGRKILTESHRLRRSVIYKDSDLAVIVGPNTDYARIHQFGGKTGRGHKVNIPPRPYMGVNNEDEQEFKEIIKDYVATQIGA